MALQLIKKKESEGLILKLDEPYIAFGFPTQEIPRLISRGYDLISLIGVMEKRLQAPASAGIDWKNYTIFTGEGIAYDGQNNAKIVLDAKPLRKANRHSQLSNGALVLPSGYWEEMYSDDVLYLSTEEVELADGRSFVKRNGVWQPENKAVGKVWEHLSRGKNLQEYAELAGGTSGCGKALWLWFDRNTYASPVMRPLVIGDVAFPYSFVYCNKSIDAGYFRYFIFGTAPEAQHEKCGRKEGTIGTSPYRESGLGTVLESDKELQKLSLRKPWHQIMYDGIFGRKFWRK